MRKIGLILTTLVIFFAIGCTNHKQNKEQTGNNVMEKSAREKAGLPWFARYQVGDPAVVGFPGETYEEKAERMKEWRDLKYGLMLSWGPRLMDNSGMIKLNKETLDSFDATEFDAEQWVKIAKRLGFKYMVIIAKHHAGFNMFDSKFTSYDIVDGTPFKRDPIKELANACTKHGMKLVIYYSILDIHHPGYSTKIGRTNYSNYNQYMFDQVEELLTNYGPLLSLWFDGEWEESWTVERADKLRDLIRNHQPNIILNNRIGQRKRGDGDYSTTENFIPYIGDQNDPWESCLSFEGNWFYDGTNKSQSPEWALYNLCYATSRGGNFLLNLGPSPQGSFLATSVTKLEQVGDWLQINGESVYGAEKGPHNYLEWGTCTRKGDTLYYQIFNWPENGELVIPGLKTEVKLVHFLTDKDKKSLSFIRKGSDIHIKLPKQPPFSLANVLKVELNDKPEVDNAVRELGEKVEARDVMREIPKGAYFLPAGFAKIHGKDLYFYFGTGAGAQRENLNGWTNKSDWAEWELLSQKSGTYKVEITYGSWLESGTFEVEIAGQSFQHTIQKMEIRENLKPWAPLIVQYQTVTLGEITLVPGRHTLSVKPLKISEDAKKYHQGLMRLRDVTMVPNGDE